LNQAILEVDNLTVYYGNFKAVDNLSFIINEGQVCGFVGPNGAGKTTTMRVAATLLLPTYGTVRVKGIDVMKNPQEIKPIIGFMPDFFGVYDNLKVWEYLDFFGSVYGLDRTTIKSRMEEVLELTDLTVKYDSYVEELSRGMKQRLCLAKTLMHDPELLILDEPASGLDPKARLEIQTLLKKLSKLGKTIFISSHIMSELENICTHLVIIECGKLVKAGPIYEIGQEEAERRYLLIRCLNPEKVELALKDLTTVYDIQKTEELFRVEIPNQDEVAAQVIEALVEKGARPIAIDQEKSSLIERFIQVTKGKVQ